MNELNYSSMDMAQETGLTTEGLRFYEKNGIIEVKKRENGYRVYDIMQVPLLRMVKILNAYGIPLSEITGLVRRQDDGLDDLGDALERQAHTLEKEIWWRQVLLRRLKTQRRLVDIARNTPDRIWFATLPEMGFLEYSGAKKLRRNRELQKVLQTWIAHMPATYPMPILHAADIGRSDAYCPAGFACPADDMAVLGLEMGGFVTRIPQKQYICRISRQEECGRIDPLGSVVPLLETAGRMGLKTDGDVLYMSFSAAQPEREALRLHYAVYLPVVPEDQTDTPDNSPL